MPTPTYQDPYAEELKRAIVAITVGFSEVLGLEPEVSFGTRITGKRYGLFFLATDQSNTGGRIGTPGGYEEKELIFNYRYVAVVESKVPPNNDISTNAQLNGESAYHLQFFDGAMDWLNATLVAGSNIAELRVLERDITSSQQTKEPRPYEINIVGRMSVVYFVKKDLYGVPVRVNEPTIP
jgi:hypothetical protein